MRRNTGWCEAQHSPCCAQHGCRCPRHSRHGALEGFLQRVCHTAQEALGAGQGCHLGTRAKSEPPAVTPLSLPHPRIPRGKERGHLPLPLAVWPWGGHVPSLNLFLHLQQGDDSLHPDYLRGCREGQLREGHSRAHSAGGVSGCEVNRAAPGCHVPGPWFHPVALCINPPWPAGP